MFWVLGITLILALLLFGGVVCCFVMCFYAKRKKPKNPNEYRLPEGAIYEPYYPQMLVWMKETDRLPCREMEIKSFDGLTLRGRYYQYSETAPVELMMPGYRGNARRDLCGAVQRCFALGHSALIVDQRACGRSEGHVISFGVNESRDCLAWIDYAIKALGKDTKLILTGISMGAATVLITAGAEELPANVVGVLADCGYSSADEIIKKVIHSMHLPVKLAYPMVRFAGKLLGGFDVEKASPREAMKHCRVPVIFAHGLEDDFVPNEMSRICFENCTAHKKLLLVPGAGHCLCYPIDIEHYIRELKTFWEQEGVYR